MKEIKFRAWHKKYKIWLNVTAIDLENKTILIAEEITKDKKEYHTFTFDEIILEQCTCLKDKNGKEIYEGDIVETCLSFGPAGERKVNVPIKLSHKGINLEGWTFSEGNGKYLPTIIGNVHENKGLLG